MNNNTPPIVDHNMSLDNLSAASSPTSSQGSVLDSSTDRCSSPETSVSDTRSNTSLVATSADTDDEEQPKKKARTTYTKAQTQTLLKIFNENPYPDAEIFENIGNDLGLPENKIKIWFQNRRARTRRKVSANTTHLQPLGVHAMMSPMTSPTFPYGYIPMQQMHPSHQTQQGYYNGFPYVPLPNNNHNLPVSSHMSTIYNSSRLQSNYSFSSNATKADNQTSQSGHLPSAVGNNDRQSYHLPNAFGKTDSQSYLNNAFSSMPFGNARDVTQQFNRHSLPSPAGKFSYALNRNCFVHNNC